MQPLRIMTLDLRAPLHFPSSCGADPFAVPESGERMARFDLDRDSARAVDPDPSTFWAEPALVAESRDGGPASAAGASIPVGRYLFAQLRLEGSRPEPAILAAAAVELQKEGLWRGMALGPAVFLRFLREEGGAVCQVLRPIASDRAE